MSLPKEPRQKMINMMYLVLTALLALNVSAEILNAFKTVNESIRKSNEVITEKNDLTYKSLDEKLKDQATAVNAKIWAPKAMEAKKISGDLFNYIEDLKTRLKKESGLEMKDGEESYREADLDAPTRLMDNMGEGPKLYKSLKDYKAQLLDILKPEEFASNKLLHDDVQKAKSDFEKELPLDLSIPKSQSGNARSGDDNKDWTVNYFHMTPTIAAMTILSKFQNDIKNSEAQIVDYCHKKIGEVKLIFDAFQPLVGTNATYFMPGDELDVTAGIGAYSKSSTPRVYVNGVLQPLNADGVADYKTKVSSSGSVDVRIEYNKPDGSKDELKKTIKYTVGTPSGVAVSADKMNVLYIMGNTPNPLTISGGSGSEKINATMTGGELKRIQGSSWEAYPKVPGEQTINVTINGKTTAKKFRVKYLPDPLAFVGTKKGGPISASEFKAIGGLITKLENSEFEAPFKVVSYKIGAVGGGVSQYMQYTNEGSRWTGQAESLVKRATPGTQVFFDEIRVVGPDGRNREIPGVFFSLK